jgi:hypothetical protein
MNKEFRSDVPPARRELACALQTVCRFITPGGLPATRVTQAAAAQHLDCSESSLSRFLSGRSLPAFELVASFHRTACKDAGAEALVGITLDRLRELHSRARAERCHRCSRYASEVDGLTRQLRDAHAECAKLRREISELTPLRQSVAEQKATIAKLRAARAGLQARLVSRKSSTPLPVPRRRGDRQRTQKDISAARQLAQRAADLNRSEGPNTALIHLGQISSALTPYEMAILLLMLRQQQDDHLADNIIHIYGRDHSDRDVLQATWALHEHGATDDAGALLRAALR